MLRLIISKLDRRCGAIPVIADYVALEQQIILVKTEVNPSRNGGDISDRNFAHYASLGICGLWSLSD